MTTALVDGVAATASPDREGDISKDSGEGKLKPSSSICVAVRLRPFNQRELDRKALCCVKIQGNTCTLTPPALVATQGGQPHSTHERHFTFDYVFDSYTSDEEKKATQLTLWKTIGKPLIHAAWQGYNVSLCAYGQTGSGKSHSMVGNDHTGQGIIPRACEHMFERVSTSAASAEDGHETSFKFECSMLEIYNERIRDLFVDFNAAMALARQRGTTGKAHALGGLRVRESPSKGVFVEGLKSAPVVNYSQVKALMDVGTKNRTIAATNMNETSSRAHTIFTVKITQTKVNHETSHATDTVSCINLVDLAGSERANATGAKGDRLRESGHINKSLSVLGNCISALAYNAQVQAAPHHTSASSSSGGGSGSGGNSEGNGGQDSPQPGGKQRSTKHVPYRDSVLTHLLRNSLGGNAFTTMLAAVSPADINFEETLSTLKYADRAKRIKNRPVVNEDVNVKMIRELKEEVTRLRNKLKNLTENPQHLHQASAGGSGYSPQHRTGKAQERSGPIASGSEDGVTGSGESDDVGVSSLLEEERRQMRAKMENEMQERLKQYEMVMQSATSDHVSHMSETHAKALHATNTLTHVSGDPQVGGAYLSNINEDPALSNVLQYALSSGVNVLGTHADARASATNHNEVVMGGLGVASTHACIRCEIDDAKSGVTSLYLSVYGESRTVLNGVEITVKHNAANDGRGVELHHNDRLIIGNNNVTRVCVAPACRSPHAQAMYEDSAIDWEFAMKELNSEVIKRFTLTQHSAERDETFEKEKGEMEKRMHLLESALDEERRKNHEPQQSAHERELELKLAEQVRETQRLSAVHAHEVKARALLDHALISMLPLVHEANTIAEEMRKRVTFAIKLISVADAHAQHGSTDTEAAVLVTYEADAHTHEEHGTSNSVMWSNAKFNNRIYLMREMYQAWVENDRQLSDAWVTDTSKDPFYDPPEDQLIGVSRIQLQAVHYLLDVDESTPLVDYKGERMGVLHVCVTPKVISEDGVEVDMSEYDDVSQLRGGTMELHVALNRVCDMPLATTGKYTSVYASFRPFAVGAEAIRTPRVALVHPEDGTAHTHGALDFAAALSETVTDEFASYTSTAALAFEVWLSHSPPGDWGHDVEGGRTQTDTLLRTMSYDSLADADEFRGESRNAGGRESGQSDHGVVGVQPQAELVAHAHHHRQQGPSGGHEDTGGSENTAQREEVLRLRAENADLKEQLKQANTEIEELRQALQVAYSDADDGHGGGKGPTERSAQGDGDGDEIDPSGFAAAFLKGDFSDFPPQPKPTAGAQQAQGQTPPREHPPSNVARDKFNRARRMDQSLNG